MMNCIIDMEENDNRNMPVTRRGLLIIIAGVAVMCLGYILMTGGGSSDPHVFNPAMFDFRRITLAPIVILAGIAVVIYGIMSPVKNKNR